MPIRDAVLMCHAPIVIPEIAGARAKNCMATTAAMKAAAEHLVSRRPDRLIVLSPHTPRFPESFGMLSGGTLTGDFGDFGYAEIQFNLPNALDTQAKIRQAAHGKIESLSCELDHGAMVPLHFLLEAGWKGPTTVIAFPYSASHEDCRNFGKLLVDAAEKVPEQSWAILASGDMSHRLQPDAPAGYHPDAEQFDQFIVQKIQKGDLNGAAQPSPRLRELAGEDVVDSLEIASAAVRFDSEGSRFLSYEGPFGVGYLVAILHSKM